MALYCMLEDFDMCLKLAEDDDDGWTKTVMAVCYFKQSRNDKCLQMSKEIYEYNFHLWRSIMFNPDEEADLPEVNPSIIAKQY